MTQFFHIKVQLAIAFKMLFYSQQLHQIKPDTIPSIRRTFNIKPIDCA